MKRLWICVLLLPVLLNSCKDKNKIDPDAEEYFSFYADGEYFYYPQEKGLGFGGTGQTLKAGKSGTTAYRIYAYSRKNPVATGAVSFGFSENHIPDNDTIMLNGASNTVGISKFKTQNSNYELYPPLTGSIIFTERNSKKLTGTFEFNAYKLKQVGMEWQITDTIIHITQGKFSIIPSN
jgi:hypothetical protein